MPDSQESIDSLEYLLNENKRLQTELSESKLQLFESRSESSILLETIHTQHQTLNDVVKQLDSLNISSNINHKYKRLQQDYLLLQEHDSQHQKQNTLISCQLVDSKITITRLEVKLNEFEKSLVHLNDQIKKKNMELNRMSEMKLLLEIELKNCNQITSITNTFNVEHSVTPLKPSKQHTFDFEKQSVDMNHLKEDVRCASNDPVKENQSQRSDSSEYMKSVMRNFDKNNDISKMDYLMDELDRKGATIQERRNLDGRIIKKMHGMKNLNKDTDALKLSSRENGRNQNILEMNQVSSDSSNMNGRMNKKKGVLHVNDTFIREENKQVTNTIDNVMLKINNLERELYEYN